jgi:hypothetical protein
VEFPNADEKKIGRISPQQNNNFLDGQPGLEYVVNMAANQVLDRLVKPAMETARRLSQASGKTDHVYGEFQYKTEKTLCRSCLQSSLDTSCNTFRLEDPNKSS